MISQFPLRPRSELLSRPTHLLLDFRGVSFWQIALLLRQAPKHCFEILRGALRWQNWAQTPVSHQETPMFHEVGFPSFKFGWSDSWKNCSLTYSFLCMDTSGMLAGAAIAPEWTKVRRWLRKHDSITQGVWVPTPMCSRMAGVSVGSLWKHRSLARDFEPLHNSGWLETVPRFEYAGGAVNL